MKRKWITLLVLLSLSLTGKAQNITNSAIENYINQYKDLAMSEQIRTGVPAAITLAQGIFETGGGTSELCQNAHNHFGVKCKGKWQGATYSYDDDQKGECFRKYQNDRQSYMDHSNFLKNNPRYSRLFTINPKHYRKWAEGLRECGYATNKQYAHKLIGYIEQYNLEQYTVQALDDAQFVVGHGNDEDNQPKTALLTADNGLSGMAQVTESAAAPVEEEVVSAQPVSENKAAAQQATPQYQPMDWDTVQFYVTTKKNGLSGFYAPKGDLLLEYAIKHYIRYGKLLGMNNLPDEPLAANMFIYLEKKRKRGLEKTFQVSSDMDLIQVSQATAVDLEQLRLLNHLQPGENPAPGTILQLQEMSAAKPALALAGQTVQTTVPVREAPVNPSAAVNTDDDYVVLQTKEQPTEKIAAQAAIPATDKEAEEPAATSEEAVAENSEHEDVTPSASASEKEIADHQEAETDETAGDKQMSKLEKLRARMNGFVYGDKAPTEESAQQAAPAEVVTEKPANISEKEAAKARPAPEKLTPNEKLRAYMKSVKENQLQDDDGQEYYTTLPAGQMPAATPASEAPAEKHAVEYYTVKRGDTAFGIAKKFGISLTQLKDWNRLPKSMVVQVGDKLKVAP